MVRYQNLTRKPELFRAPLGPGTMYPLNPLGQALEISVKCLREKHGVGVEDTRPRTQNPRAEDRPFRERLSRGQRQGPRTQCASILQNKKKGLRSKKLQIFREIQAFSIKKKVFKNFPGIFED